MGVLRGIVLIFVCVLLFVSLFVTGVFATLDNSLDYKIVKPNIEPIINGTLSKQEISNSIENDQIYLETYCNTHDEYSLNGSQFNLSIPCEIILNGSDSIFNYFVENSIESFYYKEYDCEFWKCFKQQDTPFFLVSEHAKNYWNKRYYLFLMISIALAVLVFFLVKNKVNFPFVAGSLLAVSFIPVAWLDTFGRTIIKIALSGASLGLDSLRGIDLNVIVNVFFSEANFVFLTGFVIGLVFLGIGITLKIAKGGFKLSKLFSKMDKKEDKE